MKKLATLFGYEIVYYKPRRCASLQTWLFYYRTICGRPAPRLLGFDFYPVWK